MTNFVAPDLEAVKRSPFPVLSTTSPAKFVAPETEAIARVAEFARTSKVAKGLIVPIPTLPPFVTANRSLQVAVPEIQLASEAVLIAKSPLPAEVSPMRTPALEELLVKAIRAP